jgi:2-keto-3-deoxy-L-rhamnonate aldolase RhmA
MSESESVTNSVKDKLRRGELTLGSWISLGHAAIAEIMAKAGFDWLVVDLEHSVIDLQAAGDLIRVIDLCGVTPLVRLTSNDPNQIKRMMDAGAAGIVVPMVNSAAEAVRAVAATRYPPAGTRSAGLGRAQGYGTSFPHYLKWQADGPLVIVQIEHQSAVANLEEILKVPGVDGFLVGPYDLSCSLGIPGQFARQEFTEAMARVRAVGQQLGCPSGLHIVEPDLGRLEQAIREGFTFIAFSVDMRILEVGARRGVARARELRR